MVSCTSKIVFAIGVFLQLVLPIATQLEGYGADRTMVSVSGISSGGCMSTQLHVAFSGTFMGVGIISGAPYYCAQSNAITATTSCMKTPSLIPVSILLSQTALAQNLGVIDHTSNMADDKVWLFSGAADSVMDPGVTEKVEEYYGNYVPSSNIKSVFSVNAEHTFPTLDNGAACTVKELPYIGKCDYDAAFELLNHIYGGGLTKPTSTTLTPGDFIEFDTREFFVAGPGSYSMDNFSYVYVPSGCKTNSGCKVHIALHGCSQGRHSVGDVYARNTGYNEVGEINDIIILYPQATESAIPYNPYGCWDWWGYSGVNYPNKLAPQMVGIVRMLERILT